MDNPTSREHIVTKSSSDHPDGIVFPPLIFLSALVIACVLQWLLPLGFIAGIRDAWRLSADAFMTIAGLSIMASGRRTLVRHGTNVSPLQPTTALATDGIYRWTRNPLYVGGTMLMIGIALVFGLDWLLLLTAPSFSVLHFGVVRQEERYLDQKFGNTYRRYRDSAPRYVWPI